MKIQCECGNVISDSTDYLPYKAHFVADQDWFELLENIDKRVSNLVEAVRLLQDEKAASEIAMRAIMAIRGDIGKATRLVYQCPNCGRLLVDDVQYHSQIFVPQDESVPKNLFRSKEGEKWKRPLRG